MSIMHRIAGVALSVGTLMLLYWLVAAAMGPAAYAGAVRCFAAWPTKLLMLGWTLAFYYHLCNGLRHLMWDMGRGIDIPTAYKAGYAVLAATVVLTGLTWACVFAQGGAA